MHRKSLAVAAAMATMIALPANAADIPIHIPLPAPPPPPVEVFAGGWYLRGDIGVSSQASKHPEWDIPVPAQDRVDFLQSGFDGGGFVGAGVGYRFNSWLRADVTGEYRAPTRYHGLERYTTGGGPVSTNEFHARKTEAVGLVNAYLDLGTWWGVTPFVGAGIGIAHVRMSDFRDLAVGELLDGDGNRIGTENVVAAATAGTRTNLAWALYAGLGYEVNERLSLELGYRYLNMGKGRTGPTTDLIRGSTRGAKWTFANIHSHDLRFGMRWNLHGPSSAPVHRPLSRAF